MVYFIRFTYDFDIGEVSDVPARSTVSTRRSIVDGGPIGDRILPASPVLFAPVELTPLLTIQAPVRRWLSEYHRFEVPGLGVAVGGS